MSAAGEARQAHNGRQPMRSQMADAAFLLALLFLTLFVSTFVFAENGDTGSGGETTSEISDLPISAAEKKQFETMVDKEMVDTATVSSAVADNAPSDDKYDFSWFALGGTLAVAVVYLGFVYRTSFIEYREVVRARFDTDQGGPQ